MSTLPIFDQAIGLIDAANSNDPHRIVVDGESLPAELVYSRRMSRCLGQLYQDADDALQLAARAQHIRRWEVPRSNYPMDRAGYHRWRTGLYSFHADCAAGILQQVGYDLATIARVRSLLKKEKLKADPQTQALEDVICVVFLEHYYADFIAGHTDEKVIGILKRTWSKMSEVGHAAAGKLPLTGRPAALVQAALKPQG